MDGDLIRRSDVLNVVKGMGTPIGKRALLLALEKIPAHTDVFDEHPEWQLYTEYRDGEPVGYRYGPDWVAMELYCEGGFKTPEEAKLRWLEYWEEQK